ncbi:septum formation inhibitor Maf [Oscillatoriales cyanobacterium LEGE 11467]|uniref:Nucleoside triphosphate pyrophosphatase n=1 Tax=Zarconia navalis LEGE 11467 TaxID=1828826 RepID=A0A928VZ80_9CYAN|nr:nucleoside triphosphate pyrophosphatase [Zarconia navalis]MBE9041973.1 septum formation inhibitor Maf [Zarconia navalis LEGE 11467]
MSYPLLILASASPARRQLLQSAGIEPVVCPSDLDESQVQLTNAVALVQTLAQLKAESIAERLRQGHFSPTAAEVRKSDESMLILACDSVLQVGNEILGKPASESEAIARWRTMSGQFGDLYTGHALIDTVQNITLVNAQVTRVYFAQVSDSQIERYVATGEPLRCAGCFAIDGKGGLFVEKIEGCHTNVIGLSLPLFRRMLGDLGYDPSDFWTD